MGRAGLLLVVFDDLRRAHLCLVWVTSPRIPKENFPCGLQNSENPGQRTTRNGVAVGTIVSVGALSDLKQGRSANPKKVASGHPGSNAASGHVFALKSSAIFQPSSLEGRKQPSRCVTKGPSRGGCRERPLRFCSQRQACRGWTRRGI